MKLVFPVFLVLVIACNTVSQSNVVESKVFSHDEYRIWSEIFCSLDPYLNEARLRVLLDKTFPMTLNLEKDVRFIPRIRKYYTEAKLNDLTNDVVRDFNEKNSVAHRVERNFGCKNYVLVSDSDLGDMFRKKGGETDGWKMFNAKYPKSGGYSRFSRIGLSPDRKQALIFVDDVCGWLCASGDYYFFVKKDDYWEELIKVNVSVS